MALIKKIVIDLNFPLKSQDKIEQITTATGYKETIIIIDIPHAEIPLSKTIKDNPQIMNQGISDNK
ncbi:hypothetical protein [Paenibacillus etheri]|uniref:hypothetical protein n=1 Tax=Paenibacillus etheri TaxID=1306852 RepID=UPI001ADFDEC5|nr:hypothetical protein [Paenibacillus etheri]